MLRGSVLLILAIICTSQAFAQRIERSHIGMRSDAAVEQVAPTVPENLRLVPGDSVDPVAAMILSGLMLGAAGMFGGGYLGYYYETAEGCDGELFCGFVGAIIGGLIGETVGMTTGIHLAGGKRNSFAGDLAVAVGIAVVGTVAAPATYGISLLAVPVAQLIVGTYRDAKAARR